MPMLIEHIDAIARKKQRDVLYVTFEAPKPESGLTSETEEDEEELRWFLKFDWEHDPMRQQVCEWLTDQHICWFPCGYVASEHSMGRYQGQIYIDVPFDETDPTYQRLQGYLEHPDGSMRFPTVKFWYLPLEKAMENAHHDEPGFWEAWAENF